MLKIITIVHVASTLLMGGLCLFVAVVHYPLLAKVGNDAFNTYERAHTRLTGLVVAPLMLIELATALLLLALTPKNFTSNPWWSWPALAALALLACVWTITFAVNVPQHNRLCQGWDAPTHRALVISHALRTALWLARGLLVLWVALSPTA